MPHPRTLLLVALMVLAGPANAQPMASQIFDLLVSARKTGVQQSNEFLAGHKRDEFTVTAGVARTIMTSIEDDPPVFDRLIEWKAPEDLICELIETIWLCNYLLPYREVFGHGSDRDQNIAMLETEPFGVLPRNVFLHGIGQDYEVAKEFAVQRADGTYLVSNEEIGCQEVIKFDLNDAEKQGGHLVYALDCHGTGGIETVYADCVRRQWYSTADAPDPYLDPIPISRPEDRTGPIAAGREFSIREAPAGIFFCKEWMAARNP